LSFRHTDFLSAFAARTIFAFVVIMLYVLLYQRKHLIVQVKFIPKLVYVSLAATLFADLLYIYGLTRVPVVNAVLIGHMQPVFVVLYGFFLLKKDRLNQFDYLGISCMIIAGFLVTTKTISNMLALRLGAVGDLYVLLATMAWATTAVIARKYLRPLSAGTIAFYRFLFAGIIFLIYMVAFQSISITSIYQVLLGVVIGIGTILYYEGIKSIKAAQVSALELSTPFFATLLGYLVLHETITFMQFIGIIFLLGGIYFLAKKESYMPEPKDH
jgi:drug/metabolite transporter (DMT)-like permease